MSADDFQSKYSSVMESMLRSAVSETTKLFETMVDELKAEISRMKKENDDLKTRCSLYENETGTGHTVCFSGKSEPAAQLGHDSGKRDTAVQCNLAPFCTASTEQDPQLSDPLMQTIDQQRIYEELKHCLHDHNYDNREEGNFQVDLMLLKQEGLDDYSLPSGIKEEEDDPNDAGPRISKVYSTNPLFEINQEMRATLDLPSQNDLHMGINQGSRPDHSPVLTVKDVVDDVSEEKPCSPDSQPLMPAPQQPVMPQECRGEKSIPPSAQNKQVACKNTKNDLAKGGSKSVGSNTQPVQERAAIALASVSSGCSSETQNLPESELPLENGHSCTKIPSPAGTLDPAPLQLKVKFVKPRERCTSVTLQDAMLLVEAMNQRMPSSTVTQCASNVGCSEETDSLSIEVLEATSSQTKICRTPTTGQTRVAESSHTRESQCHDTKASIPKENIVSSEMPSSSGSHNTTGVSHMITLVTGNPSHPMSKLIFLPKFKLSTKHTVLAVSPKKTSSEPTSADAGSPRETIVSSCATTNAKDQQPGFIPYQNPVIPQNIVVSGKHQSQTIPHQSDPVAVPTEAHVEPTEAESSTSPEVIPPAQHLPVNEDSQTADDSTMSSDNSNNAAANCGSELISSQGMTVCGDGESAEISTISSQNNNTNDTSQAELAEDGDVEELAFCGETPNVSTVSSPNSRPTPATTTVSNTNAAPQTSNILSTFIPTEPMLTTISPVEQKPSPVVKLFRLPMSLSSEKSVSVSGLLSRGRPKYLSYLARPATQDEEEVASLSIFNDSPISESVNSSQISEEKSDILEFENEATSPSLTQPSVSVGEPGCNFEEGNGSNSVEDCDDCDTEDNGAADILQLASIPSNDASHPRSQMTKAQFLAQLAVTPALQGRKRASNTDACCSGGRKSLQTNSIMSRLRSHLKSHSQARKSETNTKPGTESDAATIVPKKARLENDNKENKSTPIDKSKAAEEGASLNKTATKPIPKSPQRTAQCEDDSKAIKSVSETTKNLRATRKSISKSRKMLSLGQEIAPLKNIKSTPVGPRRSCQTKDVHPKKVEATCRKLKATSVSPRRVSIRHTNPTASPKQTKSPSVSPKTPITSRKPGVSDGSPESTCLSENARSNLSSTNQRVSNVTPDCSKTRPIKRESNSFSPHKRTTFSPVAPRKRENCSQSVNWHKAAAAVSPTNTAETTPAKKLRETQEVASPKKKRRVVSAKKLAKIKIVAKMKRSDHLKRQNLAKPGKIPAKQPINETGKKCKSKSVWVPPIDEQSTELMFPQFPVKKEANSPNDSTVYLSSGPLGPITVTATSLIAPLQPLAVIGGRLLKNQCGECGRILSSPAALESHVSIHTGHRPFSCTNCGKTFPDSKSLRRHNRVHRNGRIHVCHECGKGFVYRFILTKHLQMVHSRIKPFVCQICSKGFYTRRDVEAHIRTHTGEKPFQCNLCEKRFTRRVELNVHLRWHNGEKRHWCSYCGKGFLDLNNLKRHKYIHTGEKPHACPHCSKHFTQSGHLKKHVKNVHKIH